MIDTLNIYMASSSDIPAQPLLIVEDHQELYLLCILKLSCKIHKEALIQKLLHVKMRLALFIDVVKKGY